MKTLVKDLMTKNVVSLSSQESMHDAFRLMFDKKIRHIVVMDKKELVGILSDRDVLGLPKENLAQLQIKNYMSWPVYTVSETTSLEKVVEEFLLQKVSAFVVQDLKGHVKGIVTTNDLLSYMLILMKRGNSDKHPPLVNELILY